MCICAGELSAGEGQKWLMDLLKLEVQVVVNHPIQVLGTEFSFSAGSPRVLNHSVNQLPFPSTLG